MDFLRRSWAEVDLDRLCLNYQHIKEMLSSGSQMLAVVKADAYGHGDQMIASELEKCGVRWFGVSNIEEALRLRNAGVSGEILIFGPTPMDYLSLVYKNDITQTVHTMEYARLLMETAQQLGVVPKCHIKVDSGMHRIGFDSRRADTVELLEELYRCPQLHVTGIFTHFASADELCEDGVAYTKEQFAQFMAVCSALEARGVTLGLRHACNSAGTLLYPEMHLDMVRCGIILYGLDPSPECRGRASLEPVMDLYTIVTMVKEIEPGDQISYGRIYTANEKRRVATAAIGYADGYNRTLSNTGRMLVRGQYAPVIGRVCMDQLLLDVTEIPDVAEGDLVTIVGNDGANTLSFDEMAEQTGTINYEKTCLVGRRVTRVYRKGGKLFGVMNYILQEEK